MIASAFAGIAKPSFFISTSYGTVLFQQCKKCAKAKNQKEYASFDWTKFHRTPFSAVR
jgi:hypothetical protein